MRRTIRTRVRAGGLVLAAGAALVAPAPSLAAFGLTGLSAAPADTQAGANSDFSLTLGIAEPEADVRDLEIALPAGQLGDPQAATACAESDLLANACPPSARVGSTTTGVTAFLGPIPIPLTVPGEIFNLAPQPGEAARLGIVLTPLGGLLSNIYLQSPITLREADGGLTARLANLPDAASGIPIDITSVALTLEGTIGDPPRGFARNPTSCGLATTRVSAVARDGQTAAGEASYAPTGCELLGFEPGLEATLVPMGKDTLRPALESVITQRPGDAGLRGVAVQLPSALGPEQSLLGRRCARDLFLAGACPPDSVFGEAEASSPLLPTDLSGPLVLVDPPTPGLPRLGVDLRGPVSLRVEGTVELTALGTRVSFDGLPDLPLSSLALAFDGGPDGLLRASRQVCDPPPLELAARLSAHSGATRDLAGPARIDGPCDPPPEKRPKAKLKLRAAKTSEPRLSVRARAGSVPLERFRLRLPRGLELGAPRALRTGLVAKASGQELGGGRISIRGRTITLKAERAGSFALKAGGGALRAGAKLDRPRFELGLRDAEGKRSRFSLRPR